MDRIYNQLDVDRLINTIMACEREGMYDASRVMRETLRDVQQKMEYQDKKAQ